MDERSCVIGIDCSTTATKAIAFDRQGGVLTEGRREFTLSRPHAGWHEQDPESWWTSTAGAVRDVADAVGPERIVAVGITHQRESFACLDERGRALRPAILWLDGRAGEQIARYGNEDLHRISGKPPDITPALYKLLWLREHEPEVLERAVHVVDVHGYLVQRLTGQWTTSWATADPLGLVDMESFEWSPELLELVGLTTEQLPSLVAPGDVIAELGDDVARDLGLKPGTPIVAGAGDGQCAGLGANITEPGRAYLNMGTAVVSGVYSDPYRWDPAYRTLSGPIPRTYDLETVLSSGTYVVAWYVERFEREPDAALGLSAEQILEAAAAQVEPGCEGLVMLPYLNSAQSPYWDADARGAFVGWRGVHGRAHMYRAVMEGIAYALRQQGEGVEASVDTPVERYVAMGGGSRSPLWMQMVADVTRRPVTLSRSVETTALGAAILAAAAVELHGSGDIRAAAEAMSGEGRTFEPEETHQARYDAVYDVYRDLYPALRDLFPRIEAAVRKPSAVGSSA